MRIPIKLNKLKGFHPNYYATQTYIYTREHSLINTAIYLSMIFKRLPIIVIKKKYISTFEHIIFLGGIYVVEILLMKVRMMFLSI